jgi:hypothetical protein
LPKVSTTTPRSTTTKPRATTTTTTAAQRYDNCTAMHADYPHGVAAPGRPTTSPVLAAR